MLEGKRLLVTGAASGIGRAAVLMFAGAGARVLAADRDAAGLAETIAMADADTVHGADLDIADEVSVVRAVGTAVERLGGLDGAFNNAGIQGPVSFTADYPTEAFDRVMTVNVRGTFLCLKHQIARLLAQGGGGSIVNTASVMGLKGSEHVPAYIASKHAIVGLSRAAALEYARQGIRVNALCPGVVNTPFLEQATGGDAGIRDMIVAQEPIGRGGTPEEIANAALWLLSDASRFVTGSAMAVDGGMGAR